MLESSLLAKAQEGILSGDYGADRWYETKKRTVERLSELVVILKNEKVEDGALVRLYIPDEHTALKRALEGEGKESLLETKSKTIKKLLGGTLTMATHITQHEVSAVLEIIDGWELGTPFTWENLCKKYERKLHSKTS